MLGTVGEPGAESVPVLALDEQAPSRPRSRAWRALVWGLVGITLLHLGWVFRATLVTHPELRRTLSEWGVPGIAAPAPFRDVTRIALVSRDLHPHPSLPEVLVLSATLVNLADQPQPYPDLTLALLDADQRPLAARRFAPREYLLAGPEPGRLLPPDTRVPLLLEFVDPGAQAVGYELEFH